MAVFDPKTAIPIAIGLLTREENDQKLVLISQRLPSSHLGGLWELPGGKIEANETPSQALAREFKEELGLEIKVGGCLEPIEHAYEDRSIRLLPHWCRLRIEASAQNLQVVDHQWIAPSELDRVQFPPANGPLIEQLIDGLWP